MRMTPANRRLYLENIKLTKELIGGIFEAGWRCGLSEGAEMVDEGKDGYEIRKLATGRFAPDEPEDV